MTARAGDPAARRRVTVSNAKGLHARAAAKFVRLAQQYEAEVTVSRDGVDVGGQSIMGLMMLAAGPGTEIEIAAAGPDAEAAVAALAALVEGRFGEE
jgi:phosphocarrier protein